MKKLLFIALMLSIGIGLNAATVQPLMTPMWWDIKSDTPFIKPLEDVCIHFDHPIKLMPTPQKVEVVCDGQTVAESISADVVNDKASTSWEGTLVVHFGKQYLPKGKTYRMIIHKGTVGWTELYDDVQVVNMEAYMSFFVPETLGEPDIHASSQISDSKTWTTILYPYETAALEDARFQLYREGEKIGEYPLDITNYVTPRSYIRPAYDEFIPFEQDVRYSLVLPAGSLSSIYRDDITNEEVTIDFIGCYVDPSLPFSYVWCSRYTDHSNILGEVTFTYDRPIVVTDEAKVQLWEGDCVNLVKEVTPWLDTSVNCWVLVADFGGIPLTSDMGYTIVIPNGALVAGDETGVKSERSQLSIAGSSGVETPAVDSLQSEYPIYDVFGRRVLHLNPGSIYIQNGKKFVHHK